MRIRMRRFYIEVQSFTMCELIDRVNGIKGTKAAAFWPILFLRYPSHSLNDIWINHEKIHFRQQLELLFVLYWLIYYGEILLYRFVKKQTNLEAYLNSAFEQECYVNQSDATYLKHRKPYSWLRYFKHKKLIRLEKGSLQIR